MKRRCEISHVRTKKLRLDECKIFLLRGSSIAKETMKAATLVKTLTQKIVMVHIAPDSI